MTNLTKHPQIEKFTATYVGLEHAPYTIIVKLDTPHIGYHPIHLDGILSWAVAMLATDGKGVPPIAGAYDIPLPLKKAWEEPFTGLPLWATTNFYPLTENECETVYWHKRLPRPELIQRHRNKAVNIRGNQGANKEYRMPLPSQTSLLWRATIEGNAEEVGRLLEFVGQLAKKRVQGYGIVCQWQIEPADSFSLLSPEGRPLRPIPSAAYLELSGQMSLDMSTAGWTPPYWLPVTQRLCVLGQEEKHVN